MSSESSYLTSENSDQSSENSDQDSDDYELKAFAVVRAYVNDKERYDCIPSSWIVFDRVGGRGYQTTVTYRFPSLAKLGKGIKFRKNLKAKKSWPKYNGKMLLDTDSKAQAFRFIKNDKDRIRRLCKEAGDSYSSTSELDSDEEDNSPKKGGTKRKQTEQKNKNTPAKLKKVDEELDKKNDLEKNELFKDLHPHCKNLYEEFIATYQKSMSIFDNTAEYLQNIISTRKTKPSVP